MTEKELIKSIKTLKTVKPRQDWVVLAKARIFDEPVVANNFATARKASFTQVLSFMFAQKKFAYSLAAFMFIVVGLIGFGHYTVPGDALFPLKKITEQSQAALTGQTVLRQNMASLNNRINDLAQVAKAGRKDSIPSAINEVKTNASQLAKDLKENSVDSATLKEIAVSLKTLADVTGTDATITPDVKDLYETVVAGQITDLEKSTLTDEQKETLKKAKELFEKAEYTTALETILLIN